MKLSFSTRGWADCSWEELMATAADMRFGGIEMYNAHKQEELFDKGGPFHKYSIAATIRSLNDQIAQATLTAGEKKDKVGIHFHSNGDVRSIHLLNYDYDAEADKVLPIKDVTLTARVDGDITAARCYGLEGDIEADITVENGILKASIPALPLYAVIELL